MFTDSIRLTLSAGKGGNGIVAWRREKYLPKGGPTGGNGGRGGNVYIECDHNTSSLDAFRNKRLLTASHGKSGGPNKRRGPDGKSLVIKVPPGTLVKDAQTSEVIYDLTSSQKVLLCEGGKGGLGNAFFKTSKRQAPKHATPGKQGQEKLVELELKLIADVGLVGLPNAGKSTLTNAITALNAKIGAYPFTTLNPNLCVLDFEDYTRLTLADIPGIIENAHKNKGLGLKFLKHIERSKYLMYVIDAAQEAPEKPFKDFQMLQEEIKAYDASLLERPYVIILNKAELPEAKESVKFFRKNAKPNQKVITISAKEKANLSALINALYDLSKS